MKPVIAVPYFPGSNGDHDAISRIQDFGMEALRLYFHIGDEGRLAENAQILATQVDGAIMPGGFPYEDRLGFGRVPAKIAPFTNALRALVNSGKPVMAFCSGNQVAHAMDLLFDEGSPYKVRMLPNICDRDGKIVYEGFLDARVPIKLVCPPERTAFTRLYKKGEVMDGIIDHGGGRVWADKATLRYLLDNGMVVTQYTDRDGRAIDNFPVNPNGSMLNIEALTNRRGNLHIGMVHHERLLNALRSDRANLVFESMRGFIEDGCPDLSAQSRWFDIPIRLKDYSYLSPDLDPTRTVDIYIKMLTDDNEQRTAELFLGGEVSLARRRLLRLELSSRVDERSMRSVVTELARLDFLDGIMLKKDLPTVTSNGRGVLRYQKVTPSGDRDFRELSSVVEGFDIEHRRVDLPNPHGHSVKRQLQRSVYLAGLVTNVVAGEAWFFQNEQDKTRALEELLG